jgi:predicted transcriptional regulator
MQPTTVRLDAEIRQLLLALSREMSLKPAQVIRHAIKELAKSRGII